MDLNNIFEKLDNSKNTFLRQIEGTNYKVQQMGEFGKSIAWQIGVKL